MEVTETQKHQILTEISLFELDNKLLRSDLAGDEEILFGCLERLKHYLFEKNETPPLLLLEIFLFTYRTGYPVQRFIMDWLYKGARGFHQAEGQDHFELSLGFTAKSGKYTGQGHEFVKGRRENRLNRGLLYTWIAMLNKFGNYSVENATYLVHLIHEKETKGKRGYRKGLTYETLLSGYKAWKGKKSIETDEAFRNQWEYNKEGWAKTFRQFEEEGVAIPKPKTSR
jgi:hypothetical protein